MQTAYSRNGLAESHEVITIQFVSPAEAMDDPSDGFSGNRMSLIVSQLVVLDVGAVFVSSASSSEINGCLRT